MGDLLQLVELDAVSNQPTVVADLNLLTTDRGVILERDTLNLPGGGTRKPRWSELPGRYGGQRQVGEGRDNAVLAATFHVRGGPVQTPLTDNVMFDVEELVGRIDTPDMVGRWLLFRPEDASTGRVTLYKAQGAGDWRPRYIKNALTGGNVLAVELSVPVVPKAYGLPADSVEDFTSAARFADDWTEIGGAGKITLSTEQATQSSAFSSSNDPGVTVLHDRSYPVDDREQLVEFAVPAAGTEAFNSGVGMWLKRLDNGDGVFWFVRNRVAGQMDALFAYSRVGGVDTIIPGIAGQALTVDIPGATIRWIRARIVGNVVTVEYFNTASVPDDTTVATTTASGTIAAGDQAAVGSLISGKQALWFRAHAAGYAIGTVSDRPFTQRAVSSLTSVQIGRVPGNADADAEVDIYHRSGNRPRFALIGLRRKGSGPATPSFGVLSAWAGDGVDTAVAGAEGGTVRRFALSAAGASGLRPYVNFRADGIAPDAFSGYTVPVLVFARAFIPATMVTPRLAVGLEAVAGVAASRLYAVDSGTVGRSLTLPSSGTPARFFPVGVVLADTRVGQSQRLFVDLSYGPGSSGNFDLDYLLAVPLRTSASSPTGKESSTYPDFLHTANYVKRIGTDLSARARLATPYDSVWTPSPGLGGGRLELAPGRNDLIVKLSDLIPDDPTPAATSEELAPTCDVRVRVHPCYRLWRDE